MLTAVQVVDESKTEAEAHSVAEALRLQDGFLGLRVLQPSPILGKHMWRVQAFFDATGVEAEPGAVLADDMRLVLIPESLRHEMGVEVRR